MRYFNKTKTIMLFAVVAVSLGVVSCRKDFLDINNNPNAVTTSSITPELIFPGSALNSAGIQAGGAYTFLNNWMGYTGASGDFVPDLIETKYDIDFGFANGIWNGHYETLFDLFQVKKMALAKGDSVLAGASMILSDKLWQELVDLYGNIPYTDAFHLERTSTPTYDRDSSIYRMLQGDLDQAISYMGGTAAGTYANTVAAVIHFGGTPTGGTSSGASQANWIRFANTLKLRLLLHSSEVATPNVNRAAELAKIIANGGVLQAGQSVSVNPGYLNSAGKQSPYYANFGYGATGIDASTIVRANKYTVDSLNARADQRLARFYRGAGATTPTSLGGAIVGVTYGAVSNPTGVNSSKVGFGTANNAGQDQWLLTSVESLFLQAEAIQRGWLPGSGAAAYQAAVNESFTWLGVPTPTVAAAALTAPSNPLVNYASASTNPTVNGNPFSAIKLIAYQKYVALNQLNPQESYADLRRLRMIPDNGYISVNSSRLANNLPNRLPYPQAEYTLNFANVSAQGVVDKTTIFTTAKIFWQP